MRVHPLLLLLLVPSVASAWPAEDAWVPLQRGGTAITDVVDDNTVRDEDAHLDLAGPAAVLWHADVASLFIRLRIVGDPVNGAHLWPATWGVLIDSDGVSSTVEWALVSPGGAAPVDLYRNEGNRTGLQPASWLWQDTLGLRAAGDLRTVLAPTDEHWFLDFRVPRAAWRALTGLSDTDGLRMVPVTGLNLFSEWDDVGGCDNLSGPCALSDVLSNAVYIDRDLDGLTDPLEANAASNPTDADTDNDGVLDGADAGVLTCDTDSDGILDGVEQGVTSASGDTNTDADCFEADEDPSTTTDPTMADTDGGGLDDGLEDWNLDGTLDPWETDPNDGADDMDSDDDGIADVLELLGADGNVVDADSDGDGLSDTEEFLDDADNDGIPNFLDLDSDGDGISDLDEGDDDPDEDEKPNYLDLDSDGDGLSDAREGGLDTDADGTPNYLDDDSDGDGVSDVLEGSGDGDCDGIPNAVDANDGDGPCGEGSVDNVPFETEEPTEGSPFGAGAFTGGSCATASGSVGWWLVLLSLLIVSRRADAQEVNAQRFRPAFEAERFAKLADARVPARGTIGAGVWLGYADDPFVYRPNDQGFDEIAVLGAVATLDLNGSYSFGPARVGVSVPVHLYTAGHGIDVPTQFGDVRVSAMVAIVSHEAVALAAVVDASLATGSKAAWVGAKQSTVGVALAASAAAGPLIVAANLGARTGSGSEIGTELVSSAAATWGAGISVPLTEWFSASVEADGELWLESLAVSGAMPAEWLLSARVRPVGALLISVGGGTGLTTGVGAPDFRMFMGVSYSPQPDKPDADAPDTSQ